MRKGVERAVGRVTATLPATVAVLVLGQLLQALEVEVRVPITTKAATVQVRVQRRGDVLYMISFRSRAISLIFDKAAVSNNRVYSGTRFNHLNNNNTDNSNHKIAGTAAVPVALAVAARLALTRLSMDLLLQQHHRLHHHHHHPQCQEHH